MTRSATDQQQRIGTQLGIAVEGLSERAAAAALLDFAAGALAMPAAMEPTDSQVELARELGVDTGGSRRTVGARIADRLEDLRLEAAGRLALERAEIVEVTAGPLAGRREVVSSVDRRGRVWFRGGHGSAAWATDVARVS